MKTATIYVHGDNGLEIFIENRMRWFEFWSVGIVKGCRQILDHHFTHDDLEQRLYYQHVGDIRWTETLGGNIPIKKHANANEMEAIIKRGGFVDRPSVVEHLGFGSIDLLGADRKTLDVARTAMIGEWSDGHLTLVLGPKNKLEILSATTAKHFLNRSWPIAQPILDWWNFEAWRLHMMNMQEKKGQIMAVLRVDQRELHFYSNDPDRIAHIFKRVA
jgi:hypothetical protein